MESRLRENDDLLIRRESELSELKNQLAEVAAAKEQAARSSVKISGEKRTARRERRRYPCSRGAFQHAHPHA